MDAQTYLAAPIKRSQVVQNIDTEIPLFLRSYSRCKKSRHLGRKAMAWIKAPAAGGWCEDGLHFTGFQAWLEIVTVDRKHARRARTRQHTGGVNR